MSLAMLFTACGDTGADADAYGNFESAETLISAKGSGELRSFDVEEGMLLEVGDVVGAIDTALLGSLAAEVAANREAMASKARDLVARIAVQDARLADLQREEARMVKLVEGKAATPKQLDDLRGSIVIQKKQVAALEAQDPGIVSQIRAFDARMAYLRQQLEDLRIVNPVRGTVVSKLAEPHELATLGRPLYRIARMDTLELRAYITGARLASLRMGAQVDVGIDRGDSGLVRIPGRVSWISTEAEFTPRTIQTREERVDMVYAFKVRVPNAQGLLKSGMPGEVFLDPAER
ncbi:MAG: HlyD family efflux transporter periplasmic adaptor subunit [Flavobacteriales bacterium]|nr:HlyD family efflux transporter periplasmic adaptor subunit [Flavobacteriales bacterium]